MTTRREFLKLLAIGSAGIAAGLDPARSDDSQNTMPKPNILLLMTDQHRFDCLGCTGNKAIRTPNLDRLAREGVRFTHAYSSTPTCTPARAALLTGLSPWRHGMLGYGKVAIRYPIEMPRLLHDAGYYTYVIGKCHYHPQRNLHGFEEGLLDESGRAENPGFISDYRQWFKKQAPDLDPDATGIGWNAFQSGKYKLPEELHPTHWTGEMAVDFISKYDRAQPFFLKVSFARPHSPYDPPQRFWDMYSDDKMPQAKVGKWADRYAPVQQGVSDAWHGDLGDDQVKHSRRGYYGSVSFIDEQVGSIIKALEERGMLENTLIVFTADHGDMLGDHNLWRKSYPYEGSAHIPMLIRWPKNMGIKADRGVVLSQPVELRDVLPTFLDAAGAKTPEKIDGKSLLDPIRGKTEGWREYIDLEHDVCYDKTNHWNALTDGKWKYIFHAYDGSEQLFDLANGPGELHDLAPDPAHAETLKIWRDRLVKHLSERGEAWVKDGRLVKRPEKMLYSPNYPGEK